jgi:hypothetical protein
MIKGIVALALLCWRRRCGFPLVVGVECFPSHQIRMDKRPSGDSFFPSSHAHGFTSTPLYSFDYVSHCFLAHAMQVDVHTTLLFEHVKVLLFQRRESVRAMRHPHPTRKKNAFVICASLLLMVLVRPRDTLFSPNMT